MSSRGAVPQRLRKFPMPKFPCPDECPISRFQWFRRLALSFKDCFLGFGPWTFIGHVGWELDMGLSARKAWVFFRVRIPCNGSMTVRRKVQLTIQPDASKVLLSRRGSGRSQRLPWTAFISGEFKANEERNS
jgi:hypothetical protein